MNEVSRATMRPTRWAMAGLVAAAAVGVVHGAFSLYWGVGGDALVTTLGDRIVSTFAGVRWLLIPVALVKIGFALLPLTLQAWGRTARPVRGVCWLGAVVLVLWGGANTLVGNLVLGGMITPDGGYDRDGMIGHAWLWDPMFLLWGLLLVAGLLLTSSAAGGGRSSRRRRGCAAGEAGTPR